MKTMYVCEKCGTQYENFEDCNDCEGSHVNAGYQGYNHDYKVGAQKLSVWKKGDTMPREAIFSSDEFWKDGEYRVLFGVYKLVKVLEAEDVEKLKDNDSEEN